MCTTVTHLEPEEFMRVLVHYPQQVYARTLVLDCGIAVLVYTCQHGDHLYYLDRVDCSDQKKEKVNKMNFYELHAEIYRKINLDQRSRERMLM